MQNRIPTPRDQRAPIPAFTPVPRKYRHDGWTPQRQRAFIDALAETGSVRHAAKRINMAPEGAYYLRRAAGSDSFRAAWEAALDFGVQNLRDIAIERAIDGVPVPVFYKDQQIGEKRWYNDRLLMFILKHHVGVYALPGARATQQIEPEPSRNGDEILDEFRERLTTIRDRQLHAIAADPRKREAWETLYGPQDWESYG